MAGRPWYAFHVKRYERKTAHLTLMQDGAYRRMLDYYYDNESPLPPPLDAVHRIVRCQSNAERQAVSAVLAQFFHLEQDGWHNDTADEELSIAAGLCQTRSDAGKAGAAKRWQTHGKRMKQPLANEKQTEWQTEWQNDAHNTVTDTNTKKEKESTPHTPPQGGKPLRASRSLNGHVADFDVFYETNLRKVARRKAEKAYLAALKRGATPEQILEGAKRYAASRKDQDPQFTQHPATWLNADGWLDEIPEPRDIEAETIALMEAKNGHEH